MIDRAGVHECLKELGISGENSESCGAIIDFACASVSARLKDKALENDPRVIFLAAATANYVICCGEGQSLGFDSFSAGDVSFSGSADNSKSAAAILAAAEKNSADIIENGAFDFKVV